MPEIKKNVRIKRQTYNLELRRKYFNRKKFKLKEKTPLEAIKEKIDSYIPKRPKGVEGKRGNPLVTIVVVLAIIAILVMLFPPQEGKGGAQAVSYKAPLLNASIKEAGVATYGGYVDDDRVVYYKLEYGASNADSLYVKTATYNRRIPNQVFLLSMKTSQLSSYQQFKYLLKKRLESQGVPLTEITFDDIETLPGGSVLVVPTGNVPERFLFYERTNYSALLQRGVDVIYVGQKFDFSIDDLGESKKVNQTTISSFPFLFETASLKSEELLLTSGLYRVKNKGYGAASALLYSMISVITITNGNLIFVPQNLDDGWKTMDDAAADMEKIITEMKWIAAEDENEVKVNFTANKTSYSFFMSPVFKEREKTILVRVVAANKGNKTEKTIVRHSRSDVNGDLFYVEDTQKIVSGKITEQDTKFIVFLNENTTEKKSLAISIENVTGGELYRRLISSGATGKTSLQGTTQFSDRISLDKGTYLAAIVDELSHKYATAVLSVKDIEIISTARPDYTNGIFKFQAISDNEPVKIKKLKVLVDGKYQYSFSSVSEFTVDMQNVLAGQTLAVGNHTFEFEFSEVKKKLTFEKRASAQFYENPLYWVMGIFALLLFGAGPVLAAMMQKTEYSLDIPDFPPLASIKIPMKKNSICDIMEKANEDYRWKSTPLKLEEIKKGFMKIIYQNRPIFISDYNLEFILDQLKNKGVVKQALDYYGLAKWEADTGRTIASLAIYRKIRDICINEAIPFTKLGESKECDIKLKMVGQDIFIYIMDVPETREKKLSMALKAMHRGIVVLLFKDPEDKKDFEDTMSSASESSGVIKLEIMSGTLIPLHMKEFEKMIKEMKTA